MEDRERLWDDFINEFDSVELHDGNGSTCSPNTNLKGGGGTIWLHEDSMNGIPPTFTERSAASTGREASTRTTAYTCGSKCGQETKPVDSRQGTGDEHRAGTDYTCC